MSPMYGQVVAGPPGSGKTVYCNGMQQYLRLLGRNAAVINLDPANEVGRVPADQSSGEEKESSSSGGLPYDCLFDICEEVVNVSSVMEEFGLGPNGGLVYCMEYLDAHAVEVVELIRARVANNKNNAKDNTYLILDLPGQVELYTHSTCVQNMLQQLSQLLDLRLAAVQLIDAHYCVDATKFLSAALLGTTTMIRLELPMVSVLSKMDLLAEYGEQLPFSFEFFADCQELQRLVPYTTMDTTGPNDDPSGFDDDVDDYLQDEDYIRARQKTRQSKFYKKRERLHRALAEVVEDFGLLGFLPLDISDAESVGRVLAQVDKCNGYHFKAAASQRDDMFQYAVQVESSMSRYEVLSDIQERLLDSKRPAGRKSQTPKNEE